MTNGSDIQTDLNTPKHRLLCEADPKNKTVTFHVDNYLIQLLTGPSPELVAGNILHILRDATKYVLTTDSDLIDKWFNYEWAGTANYKVPSDYMEGGSRPTRDFEVLKEVVREGL